ncbi:MAG TPA: hypothetical protein DEP84_37630, partial [Chloroflexi bacterium]|nr:hypothetical protein [Chloroflexota bacterium]
MPLTTSWIWRLRPVALAGLLYSVLILVLTWPVAARLTTAIAGSPNRDNLQFVWNLWWQAQALVRLHVNPGEVVLLHFPDGGRNELLSVSPLVPSLALPLTLLAGPITSYNLLLLTSFPLAGLSGYLLTRWVTGSHQAAFLGGLIFGFFPNKMMQSTQHFLQVMVFLFPLYALALLRLLQQPSLRRALVAGLILALALLVNLVHVGYFLLPLSILLIFATLWRHPTWWCSRRLMLLGVMLLVPLLLTGPIFVPLVVNTFRGELSHFRQPGTVRFSADLLAYVVPSSGHLLLRQSERFQQISRFERQGNPEENVGYLGLVPLALAGIAAAKRPRAAAAWLLLTVVMLVLALGPLLKVDGAPVGTAVGGFEVEGVHGTVPLPYMALMQLPFYSWGRIPGRQVMTAMMGLAVLAGLGLASVPAQHQRAAVLGASLLILFEYLTVWPYPTGATDIRTIPVWPAVRIEARGAVLDLPQWDFFGFPPSNEAMLAQTAHGQPIVGGYIHRLPPGTAETAKAIQELVVPPGAADIVPRATGDAALAQLRALGIATVVLHREARSGTLWSSADDEHAAETLTDWSGGPRWEDKNWAVYDLPDAPAGAPSPLWTLDPRWHTLE